MRVRRIAGVVGVGLLAAAGFAVPAGGQTGEVSQPFEFTGDVQTFPVPANVCQVTIDAFGAQGGTGSATERLNTGSVGGLGGRATATVTVTPGETLDVYVGGQGEDAPVIVSAAGAADTDEGGSSAGDVSAQQAGGFNGGGNGANAAPDDASAGGGGASDVRRGPDLEGRLVVAGGGGGGAGGNFPNDTVNGVGGAGGGENGDDGTPSYTGSPPGGGGTQIAGGSADQTFDPDATPGDLGQGGNGGFDGGDPGGGGGGGYFGGGGGASDIGDEDGGGGGGGGSGFGPADVAFETGVREGDGFVTISYDPATDSCPPSPAPEAAPVAIELVPTFTG